MLTITNKRINGKYNYYMKRIQKQEGKDKSWPKKRQFIEVDLNKKSEHSSYCSSA